MKLYIFLFIFSFAETILVYGKSEPMTYYSTNLESDHLLHKRSAEDYNDHFIRSDIPVMTVHGVNGALNNMNFRKIRNTMKNLFTFHDIQDEEELMERYLDRDYSNIPSTIYPEIFVLIENSLHVRLGGNVNNTIKYAVTFWNSVDEYFRNFTMPKIRLNLARIVIGLDHNTTLTMFKVGEVKDYNGWSFGVLDIDKTLDGLSEYLRNDGRLSRFSYDIVAVMTSFELWRSYDNEKILGLARKSNTCSYGRDGGEPSFALIRDHGGFDGIFTAVHELGHAFGATHDSERICTREYGKTKYGIMRPGLRSSQTHNLFSWSSCSLRSIRDHAKRDKCLHNVPDVDARQMIIPMPGQLQSANEQCQKILERDACWAAQDSCLKLSCEKPYPFGFLCTYLDSPPADGTACGRGRQHCMHGECVGY